MKRKKKKAVSPLLIAQRIAMVELLKSRLSVLKTTAKSQIAPPLSFDEGRNLLSSPEKRRREEYARESASNFLSGLEMIGESHIKAYVEECEAPDPNLTDIMAEGAIQKIVEAIRTRNENE